MSSNNNPTDDLENKHEYVMSYEDMKRLEKALKGPFITIPDHINTAEEICDFIINSKFEEE